MEDKGNGIEGGCGKHLPERTNLHSNMTAFESGIAALAVGVFTFLPILGSWRLLSRMLGHLGAMTVAMFFRMAVGLGVCGIVWFYQGESAARGLALGMLVVYPFFLAMETWWAVRGVRLEHGSTTVAAT
jgi:hypothetical protein